ncbi:MAG: metallophosphoesterase [Candidatus Nezhaarchaeales archaeon]
MTLELMIGAVSDVHSPKYLEDFKRALKNSPDVGLMLLAGDMIYKGQVKEYENVLSAIKSRYGECKIVACFGNEEYEDKIVNIMESYNEVTWLNDSEASIDINDVGINIIGTKGCLDRPTAWQRKNIVNINQIYEERLKKIDEMLASATLKGWDFVVLLSHYSTTFRTLIGEPRWAWPELGSSRFETVIRRRGPHIVVHGHAHNSKVHAVTIDGTQVYNVSFPATRKLTTIKLCKVKDVDKGSKEQMKITSFMRDKP